MSNLTDPSAIDVLIIHGLILTMNNSMQVIPDGAVAINGSEIIQVGESQTLLSLYHPRETIDASGMLVIPGLINTHTHSGDTLFRGLVEDLVLEDWLKKLWLAEEKFLNPDTIHWAARLAYIEMVHSGITCAVDMFWFPRILAVAARAVGFRLVTGLTYFDSSATDGIRVEQRRIHTREFLEEYHQDDLIIPCVQAHSVYTVSPQYLQEASKLAQEFNTVFHVHASETEAEVQNCLQTYGLTPIQHLDRLEALTSNTLLAHCVHLENDEFDLLAQRGATISHCPVSNLKLASGIANVSRMLRAGVKVTLGTDGPVSGNDLNLWYTMRLAALLQKAIQCDASLLPSSQVVSMATREAARALGLDSRIGSLEAGKLADITLLRMGKAHTTPCFDPYTLLVYNLGRDDVDTVLIHGRVVLKEGKLVSMDEDEVLDAVNRLRLQIQG
jgi:5-methylthioadenosine/S-adenosylhomocysteine deaminase